MKYRPPTFRVGKHRTLLEAGNRERAFNRNRRPPEVLHPLEYVVQVSSSDVHSIREKLQVILAVADGRNALVIERQVKEIDRLLPRPGATDGQKKVM